MTFRHKTIGLFITCLTATWTFTQAALVRFDFESETSLPVTSHPEILATEFTLSEGAVSFPGGNSGGDAISGRSWNVSFGERWWEFQITPSNPGSLLDLSRLQFDDRASGTGPTGWQIAVNGMAVGEEMATHLEFSSNPMNEVDLDSPLFQDLESATLRIYGFGAAGSSGTWRIDNVFLDGSVQAVPEPQQWGVYSAIMVGLLIVGRRWRRSGLA